MTGPLSSCLIMVFSRRGSMAVLSCQMLFRPVLQAGIGSPGSAGALWGLLLGTREAEGMARERRGSRNRNSHRRSPKFTASHMGQPVLW